MSKVTIVVPIYNTSKLLKRCIDSIKNQTLNDFEVIFVNDGSTDNSEEVCKALITSCHNFRILTKDNGGLSSARLYGFRNATSPYIVFVDSDDYLERDYLFELYSSIESSNADISMCGYYTDNCTKKTQHLFPADLNSIEGRSSMWNKYLLPQLNSMDGKGEFIPSFMWLRMYRRDILLESDFISERDVLLEDVAFSFSIRNRIQKVTIVNKPLYNYVVNEGSLTLSYRKNAWNKMKNLCSYLSKCLDEDNVDNSHRLNGIKYLALHFCLRNITCLSYGDYKPEFKKICHDEMTKDLLHSTSVMKLSKSNMLIWLVTRYNLSRTFYILKNR